MPLGKGIVGMLAAVADRVEVSGQAPTWRVTSGSYEHALDYAREAYGDHGDLVPVARETSGRWWPRVTVTVTTDPELAATAPPEEELAHPPVPQQAGPADEPPTYFLDQLDAIFERQEAERAARVPRQRTPDGADPAA